MSEQAERVALVLTSGGARGAYQAGAVMELLPVLRDLGHMPTLMVGESVGAFNAVALAASAHLPVERRVELLGEQWASVTRPRVLRPLWQQLPMVLLRYGGETLGLQGLRLRGLLGTGPLRDTIEALLDWRRLHDNVDRGVVDTVAVAAAGVRTGRTVVFVERAGPPPDGDEAISYRFARLHTEHVRASGAIPVLFPPVWVDEPTDMRGWYVDGSTRLHAPLRPALALGAERMVVIGTTSLQRRAGGDRDQPVDLGDAAVTLLNAMVEDPLRDDLRRLEAINAHLVGDGGAYDVVRRYRAALGRAPYRQVPFMAVLPDEPEEIADLAISVFERRYRGLRGLRDPDFEIMHRLLGGPSPLQGELLSYVLFDEVFLDELVRMGRRDARKWLDRNAGDPWRISDATDS